MRALPSHERQKRVVASIRAFASLGVVRRDEVLGPRERAVGALARLEDVPCADPVGLDSEREIGLETDRLPGTGRVGGLSAAVDRRPFGRRSAVVEGRLADELDLDAPLDALDRADEHVVGVVVRRRTGVGRDLVFVIPGAERQRLADDDPAVGRLPRRLEDVRPGDVGPCGRVVDPERREAEESGLAVEQAAEHARRVEAWDAEPVDRPVGRDERARVAVREERVLGDRRERRGRRSALDGLLCWLR